MTAGLRVVVADDQTLVRSGFAALLAAEPDIDVVGQAGTGADAVAEVTRTRPDVVLMDIRMPVLDGIEATRRIRADPALAGVQVLILTTFDLDDYVYGALRAGASGFLLKGMEPTALVHAVHLVRDGGALLAPSATRLLIDAQAHAPARRQETSMALAGNVTEREREVLVLVAEGLANADIADRLSISPLTVKSHLSSLLAKHNLATRVQLVVLAYESGLVIPGGP
ncbi:response regulator [Pseudofrankia inefficax]|uniref:Two component transcriptional regulator, LuxR family n=1 Tax=Pseudofrankia inefficax (strain DSM 45817 / CECT 9037 / DDB 130130 / EuI1c) TaxID=298654 RepID=E3J915_PSEI1|nr:response regulator [Pseudofrankia inefficax]ADP80894.1 two component transcriptional regulator, LuxR family [Pseudofrankia inefficax]